MQDSLTAQQAADGLSLAEQASAELLGPQGAAWIERLDGAHDQLRLALQWFVDQREPKPGLRLAIALYRFWATRREYLGEGREWFAKVLALPSSPADRATRAQALDFAGRLALRQGEMSTARDLYAESLAISRNLADPRGIATVLADMAGLALHAGDHEQVRRYAEACLAVCQQLDDRPGRIGPLHLLANSARMQGSYDAAAQHYAETSALYAELGNAYGIALERINLGYVRLRQGHTQLAAQAFETSIHFFRERGDASMLAVSLAGLGGVAAAQGNHVRAAILLGATEAINRKLGVQLDPDDRLEFERDAQTARAGLGPAQFDAAWAQGQVMSLQPAVNYALNVVLSAPDLAAPAS